MHGCYLMMRRPPLCRGIVAGVAQKCMCSRLPPFSSGRLCAGHPRWEGRAQRAPPCGRARCDQSFVCRGRDLISKLLVAKPKRRLTASAALGHAWFAQHPSAEGSMPLARALSNLRTLDQRFRVAVTGIVAASRMSATLSYITDGRRTTRSTDSGRRALRTTGSIVPLAATSDAADATGGTQQMWDKQTMSEGLWERTDGVLDTVVEDETGGTSHAGELVAERAIQ